MTRNEYVQHCMNRQSVRTIQKNVLPSVADPSMAQSGRDLLFNPKSIRYNRVEYAQGVPLDQMKPFDQMYAQKLDVFQDAQNHSKETKKKLEEYEKSQSKPSPEDTK